MAHQVPTGGETVEVVTEDGPADGTVLEAAGHFARVEVGDDVLEVYHESVVDDDDDRTAYRLTGREASGDGDDGDDAALESVDEEATDAAFDPRELTVDEVREAAKDTDDAEALAAALEVEEDTQARRTALDAIQERLDALADEGDGDDE